MEKPRESMEQQPSYTPPAVELLLDVDHVTTIWPESVTRHAEFLTQIQERKKLNTHVESVLSHLPPDTSLQQAFETHLLTDQHVIDLYESLSDLIANPDYRRAILYLPFEILPHQDWNPSSPALRDAIDRLRTTYQEAWHALLTTHDVRANFIDGDVLEVKARTGDLPRVVKAAHLIPTLVSLGYLTTDEVTRLMENTDDDVLRKSIAEALTTLTNTSTPQISPIEQIPAPITRSSIEARIRDAFTDINTRSYGDLPATRIAWLKSEARRKVIESTGDMLGHAMQEEQIPDAVVAGFIDVNMDVPSQQAFIQGVRKAIESTAQNNPEHASQLYAHYQEALQSLWHRNEPDVHDELFKTFSRLHGLRVVDDQLLQKLHIVIPELAGPFSKNMHLIESETRAIERCVATMESDQELMRYVYPVALMYGSRLKGYGKPNADIDIAVIVRPSTPPDAQEAIRTALAHVFPDEQIGGHPLEFWLADTPEGLAVQDDPANLSHGERSWTYILFGAVWYGNSDGIRELREKLLVPYFYDNQPDIHDRPARGLYIEELERDTLQYRLMHKGYERFFPPHTSIPALHNTDAIDGRSMFWDSGYRRIALQLFANRVFLPQLSRK